MRKRSNAKRKRRVTRTAELPIRASEREGIALVVSNLSETGLALRNLMTEQSRIPCGWATYYTGTQAQLVAAGIPEYLFALHEKPVRFRANSQDAFLQRKGPLYELTLHWGPSGPWYASAAHPALSELARMIHIDVHKWLHTDGDRRAAAGGDTLEVPVQRLLNDPRVVDYRLPPDKRFRFAKGFRSQMFALISALTHAIKNAEIMSLQPAVVSYEDGEDETLSRTMNAQLAAQDVLSRIAKRPD